MCEQAISKTKPCFWGGAGATVVILVLIYANSYKLPLPNVKLHAASPIISRHGIFAPIQVGWPLAFKEVDFRSQFHRRIWLSNCGMVKSVSYWRLAANIAVGLCMAAATFACIQRFCEHIRITVSWKGCFVAISMCGTLLALTGDAPTAYWCIADTVAVAVILSAMTLTWVGILDLLCALMGRILSRYPDPMNLD